MVWFARPRASDVELRFMCWLVFVCLFWRDVYSDSVLTVLTGLFFNY